MSGPTAVIVCGGRGTRLGPLGDVVSKSVLPIDGFPAVVHVVRTALEQFDANRCLLLTGHLGYQVEHVVRAYFPRANVTVKRDPEALGTACAVHRALSEFEICDLVYAHANVTIGHGGIDALAAAANLSSSFWALSSAALAPTHPRLEVSEGWVTGLGARPRWFSVGFGVLSEKMLGPAKNRVPVRGETTEEWLFRGDVGSGAVAAVDIGHDWSHLEDLADYPSGPAHSHRRPRRVA